MKKNCLECGREGEYAGTDENPKCNWCKSRKWY